MKTLEELQAIREQMKAKINNRGTGNESDIRVIVGMATCGIAAGARPVLAALSSEIEAHALTNVVLSQTGCIGMCKFEPIVDVIMPGKEKVTYVLMTPEKVKTVVQSHILNGNVVEEYTYTYNVAKN